MNDVITVDSVLENIALPEIRQFWPQAYWVKDDKGHVLSLNVEADHFVALLRVPELMREGEMRIAVPCLMTDPPDTFVRALRREINALVQDIAG